MLLAVTIPLAAMARPALAVPAAAAGLVCAVVGAASVLARRRREPPAARTGDEIRRPEDRPASPAAATSIMVDLACFERVRAAAGQLTAERTVAEAAARLRELVGDAGSVEQVGDDRVLLRVAPERWYAVLRGVEPTLDAIRLPGRVDPIAARTTFLDTIGVTGEEAA